LAAAEVKYHTATAPRTRNHVLEKNYQRRRRWVAMIWKTGREEKESRITDRVVIFKEGESLGGGGPGVP